MNLKEAKVLVTGGSSGIGYETAKLLIAKGAKVAICGRNKESLEKAAKELGAHGFIADVGKESDVIELVKKSAEALGGLNVLVNNAAYGRFTMLTDLDKEKFNELLDVNVVGAAVTARECAKIFTAQNYGNIVNISSTAGLKGFAGGSIYVASKFALKGMTECWRDELRKYNIRVMLVNPSEVQTNFGVNAGREAREYNASKLQGEDIAHTIVSMLELDDRGFITEATVFATNPK